MEHKLLKTGYGYDNLPGRAGTRVTGKLLGALLPMAREIAGSSVLWLNAQPKGELLDVGCGNGSFLATMRSLGWNVKGVEPDIRSASIAREEFGLSVTAGTLEDARFPPDSFDCITAHQTIEHMHAPVVFLQESFRILKPGGKLVVTTPSLPSLGHRLFGRCWRGLEPPRHLYLFSPRALGKLVERMRFRVEIIRTTARSAWEIWYASRLIHRDGKIPENFREALNMRVRLEGLIFQLFQHLSLRFKSNWGEQIVLMASKPALWGDQSGALKQPLVDRAGRLLGSDRQPSGQAMDN
ncbi:MAG: class I SAM-dependent methyltransferase [Candidatus Acidiferrales bacterium]